MAANVINMPESLYSLACAKCAIQFAVPARFERERREDYETFYCPAGHSNYFAEQSEAERLERELQNRNNELERTEAARDKFHTERDRLRTRVKKGRCPASRRCTARFHDLQEHLKKHHPRHPWRTK